MPYSYDVYQDEDGKFWSFEPPYEDDYVGYIGDEYD